MKISIIGWLYHISAYMEMQRSLHSTPNFYSFTKVTDQLFDDLRIQHESGEEAIIESGLTSTRYL